MCGRVRGVRDPCDFAQLCFLSCLAIALRRKKGLIDLPIVFLLFSMCVRQYSGLFIYVTIDWYVVFDFCISCNMHVVSVFSCLNLLMPSFF